MRPSRSGLSRALRFAPPVALSSLFIVAATLRAWVSDDAYLTFRTIDNFANGLGLRWNALERVQVYTHPLWMLLMTAVYSLTHDFYYSSIVVSLVLSGAAVAIVAFRLARTSELASLCLAAFLVSRTFLDYSTGGLENPLAHLLLAIFLWRFLEETAPAGGALFRLALIGALLGTTRLDLLLLIAPMMAWRLRSRSLGRSVFAIALGALPLIVWEIFSLFYYGFLFPNTAYAKLGTGLPRVEMIGRGMEYLLNSLRLDPLTLPIIAAGVLAAYWSRRGDDRAAGCGIVLYLFYIVAVGGDFMSGRFLTAPLLVAVALVGRSLFPGRAALGTACALVLVCSLLPPISPFLPDRTYPAGVGHPALDATGIADERAVFQEDGALWHAPAAGPWPNPNAHRQAKEIKSGWTEHTWIASMQYFGVADRDETSPYLPPGPSTQSPYRPVIVRASVGFLGYYVGPDIHILDFLALGDPLLARMPSLREDPMIPILIPRLTGLKYRIGHYPRRIPHGYFETLTRGENRIRDPDLAAYYEHLALITRGPLWDRGRLVEIVKMNAGCYDGLLTAGLSRAAPRRTTPPS